MPGAEEVHWTEYGHRCCLHRPDESLRHGQQRGLWVILSKLGCPIKFVNLICQFHDDRTGTFRRRNIRALQHLQQWQARVCAGCHPLQPVLHLRSKTCHQGPWTGSVFIISAWRLPVQPSPTDSQDEGCDKDCPGSTVCWRLCPHGAWLCLTSKSLSTSLQKPPTSGHLVESAWELNYTSSTPMWSQSCFTDVRHGGQHRRCNKRSRHSPTPVWGASTNSNGKRRSEMKICGSERDRNQWPSRYCGGSGVGLDTPSGSQHPAPHAKPDLEPAREEKERLASQQLEARHWSRAETAGDQLVRNDQSSLEQRAMAGGHWWPMLHQERWA